MKLTKLTKNDCSKIAIFGLSLSPILLVTHANKWHEQLMYTLAITVTLYSYLVAVGVICSVTVFSIWSIVHNMKEASRLRVQNLEIIKSLTKTMDEISSNTHVMSTSLKY